MQGRGADNPESLRQLHIQTLLDYANFSRLTPILFPSPRSYLDTIHSTYSVTARGGNTLSFDRSLSVWKADS